MLLMEGGARHDPPSQDGTIDDATETAFLAYWMGDTLSAVVGAAPEVPSLDGESDTSSSHVGHPDPESPDSPGLIQKLPMNKPSSARRRRVKAEDSKARKRERNREWMRQARLRKRSEQHGIHATVVTLERQRNRLLQEHGMTLDGLQALVHDRHDTEDKIQKYRLLNRSYTENEKTIGGLREENFCLRDELRRRRVTENMIYELIDEARLSFSLYETLQGDRNPADDFRWLHEIDSFYQRIPTDQVVDFLQESFAEIMMYVRIADNCLPSSNHVFGWSDKRFLDGQWANFMFEKTFPHVVPDILADKTWRMSSDIQRMRVLQPKTQQMKVLQVLDENTIIVARQNYFPNEDMNLCYIYALFRLRTANGGFIVATRAIAPCAPQFLEIYRRGGRHLFTRPLYAFVFQPITVPESSYADPGGLVELPVPGCRVQFGGRVDNCRDDHARNCLMDTILAILRWEGHCVGPLMTLTSSHDDRTGL